jgi:hypothetical protein
MLSTRLPRSSSLSLFIGFGALAIAAVSACSAGTAGGDGDIDDGGTSAGGGDPGSGGQSAVSTTTTTGGFETTTASTGSAGQPCASGPDTDIDQDGVTPSQGDCNDCDANVNPGAIEVVGTEGEGGGEPYVPVDEDCDGTADNPPEANCDEGLALTSSDPFDAARAIELCRSAADGKWGLVGAQWVRANGTPTAHNNQYGISPQFGPNVAARSGDHMLVMSSGRARDASQPEFCGAISCTGTGVGTPPAGFPQDVPSCPGDTDINDDVGLEVTLRAPTNATGYKFDFSFYSHEYPEWVCTSFNDQFIALVTPPPMGSINGNVSFDSQNNPVSVNVAFFNVCDGCPLGTAELAGTGFEVSAGGTSWLQTTAPVEAGQTFSVRFAIWDTGDQSWDSTVLVDAFEWIANAGVEVGTTPVPQ